MTAAAESWAEADALLEQAHRYRPIPVPLPGGQCVRDAVALVLRRRPSELPLRTTGETAPEWAAVVGEQFGVTLELVFADDPRLLEAIAGRATWVALVRSAFSEASHALPMIGTRPMLDWDVYRNPMGNLLGAVLVAGVEQATA